MERNKSLKAAPVDAPDFFGKRLACGLGLVKGLALAGAEGLAFVRVFVCGVALVSGLVDFITVGT